MRLPVCYHEVTPSDRMKIRQEYERRQQGQCFFCGEDLTGQPPEHVRNYRVNWKLFPGGERFLKYPVHLQHCHQSGMTEGAVHALCNAVWWQRYER